MGYSSMPDVSKPLACQKCGKEPERIVWRSELGLPDIHQVSCNRCRIISRAYSKKKAIEKWNDIAIKIFLDRKGLTNA